MRDQECDFPVKLLSFYKEENPENYPEYTYKSDEIQVLPANYKNKYAKNDRNQPGWPLIEFYQKPDAKWEDVSVPHAVMTAEAVPLWCKKSNYYTACDCIQGGKFQFGQNQIEKKAAENKGK